jgi:LmbE family N-acetylglucosaminyl deacetylase
MLCCSSNVTCLVFSPEAPTAFLGRGEDAHLTGSTKVAEQDEKQVMADVTCIDVGPYIQHKIEAIAAHRSQFPIQPDMLPHTVLQELMGQEYFVPVSKLLVLNGKEVPASGTHGKSAAVSE